MQKSSIKHACHIRWTDVQKTKKTHWHGMRILTHNLVELGKKHHHGGIPSSFAQTQSAIAPSDMDEYSAVTFICGEAETCSFSWGALHCFPAVYITSAKWSAFWTFHYWAKPCHFLGRIFHHGPFLRITVKFA